MRLLFVLGCLALALAALAVFGAYTPMLSPYVDFFGQFALQASLGAAGLALAFFIARKRALGILCLLVAALGILPVLPRARIAACTDEPVHRVLFLNVWSDNPDIAKTTRYLARSGADTIVLGEVTPKLLPALDRLHTAYPYSVKCPVARGGCDLIAYSKYPLSAWDTKESFGMIGLSVRYPDGTLALAGFHLVRPWPFEPADEQLRQAHLASPLIARHAVQLVIGDFNAVTWGGIVRLIAARGGLTPLASRGTWRANLPWLLRIPIDEAMVGPGIACAAKSVGPRTPSDHRPIEVKLAFALRAPARP